MRSPQRLLALIAEIQGILEIEELRPALLDALVATVSTDWISLNDIGPDPADAVLLARPEIPAYRLSVFRELAHENPLLRRWLETRDGRAYRFSDVATDGELRRLRLFREFYEPLGIHHQIAFTLPSRRDRVLAVALSRGKRNFTDAERDFLNDARPFLIQAYRNATEHSKLLHRDGFTPSEPPAEASLTPREVEVVRLIATGRSNAAAGEQLGISARTVQKHLQHVYRKLGVENRSDAAALLWG